MRELHYTIDTSTPTLGVLGSGIGTIGDALRCFAGHAESFYDATQEVWEEHFRSYGEEKWADVANEKGLPSAVVLKIGSRSILSYLPLTGALVSHTQKEVIH